MYDELPVYEVEELSLEEAVTILADDENINLENIQTVEFKLV